MRSLVFLDANYPDGRVADASAPQLKVTDFGATRGDGIFETMLVRGGEVRKLDAHLARLAASADMLDLAIPESATWRRAIDTALALEATGEDHLPEELTVKLIATRGVEGEGAAPTCWVLVSPLPDATVASRGRPISVLLLDRGYDYELAERAPWLLLGAKTLSYAINMAALRYAKKFGADDVIFTSADGKILEGPTSTVLVARVVDGVKTLTTPLLESGVLPGTTQSAIFEGARAAGWELGYGPLTPSDLLDADGVWLASSVRLLAPINRIDEQDIPVNDDLTAELAGFLER